MILYNYEITDFYGKVVRESNVIYTSLEACLRDAAEEHQPCIICIRQAQHVVKKAPYTFFEHLLGE